jgi:hypothetical protein
MAFARAEIAAIGILIDPLCGSYRRSTRGMITEVRVARGPVDAPGPMHFVIPASRLRNVVYTVPGQHLSPNNYD